MTRWVKILLRASVLSITVGVANVVHMMSLDLNSYTVLIAEKATESTGREFKIDGDLQLSIPLSPKVFKEGVSFANAEWRFKSYKASVSSSSSGGATPANKKKATPANPVEGISKDIKSLYGN
jgi:uncharacterized protein involved in outer membrane biogenesis